MAPRKTNRRKRKAAQEAAKRRTILNTGIIVVVVLAVIWIATSAQNQTEPAAAPQPPADAPPVEVENYDSAPPMTIDTSVQYFAIVKMAGGD
ncbi:MAG: hypothetical protein HOG15_02385 [Anaerolineae bacterium]|nr:hypothetical protein [Anaerolineae bacterium]